MRAILLAVLLIILLPVSLYAQEQDLPLLPSRSFAQVMELVPPTLPAPLPQLQVTSDLGIVFIKEVEQFRPAAYHDSGGGYAIGYGFHMWKGRRVTPVYPRRVTQAQASAELRRQLEVYEDIVRTEFDGEIPQPAFDALVSVCYNLGRVNSSIRYKIRMHRPITVADFVTTAKALNKFSPMLYARRVREFTMFLGEYDTALEMELETWADMKSAYRALLPRTVRLINMNGMTNENR